MANFKTFLQSGHPPTLFSAFLYFDFCFAICVLNGAMGPFITEYFHLTAPQTGFMISVPLLAGALTLPAGGPIAIHRQKKCAIVEISAIMAATLYGYFFVQTYSNVLAMGILLGIAKASFGVALALGSGWVPKEYKGLVMGIAGAGNGGTVLAALFAPPLVAAYGWRSVYGFATQLVPLRWPLATAVAGSMIGEVGALGGSIIPNAMGLSKEYTGSFSMGFVSFALLALAALVMLLYAQCGWTKTWVGKGGKALADSRAAGQVVLETETAGAVEA